MQVTTTETSTALPVEAENAHWLITGQVRRRMEMNTGVQVKELTSKGLC